MKDDIDKKLAQDFGGLHAKARQLIDNHKTLNDRVIRCVIHLANGDIGSLRRNIKSALTDPRDVMWYAEYDGGEDRLRDFSQPFP